VAVTQDDRIFVALPRWVQSDSFSLGEVKDGKVVPYPGGDWNTWHPGLDEESRLTTVNAVWVEPGIPDALWVVDCTHRGSATKMRSSWVTATPLSW
jgi:hypothetical protein